MVKVQNVKIALGKFNIFKICINGNYAQQWITKLYNYQLIFFASFNK